jgi:hypothetical protein
LNSGLANNLVKTQSKLVCILEAAVVLAIDDHRPYTKAWRQQLPYRRPGGPATCYTEAEVLAAAAVVYKNNRQIYDFIKKAWETGIWP